VARLQAWPNPFRKGQHFLLWPQAATANTLAQFKPDIIHSHDPLVLSLAGLQAAKSIKSNAAWLLTVHQLPWFVALLVPRPLRQPTESALWAYGRWLYKQVDTLVTPSQMIADLVTAHGSQRPEVVSNGVDTDVFNPQTIDPAEADNLRQKYGLDRHLPIMLYTGRLDVDKRVALVVRAVAKVRETLPVQFLIVGDGKKRAELESLSERLGLSALCRFTGFVPATGDLPGLYQLANVFVTASAIEIQSSVVLEAAASGLPVVAVRASSMPEFVQEGITGFLVTNGNEAEIVMGLAGQISELLNNLPKAQELGRAGRELAERHSQAGMLAGYERLYARLGRRPES
jgi:glycosyltransferase involved in cell wall biosynthesis